MQGGAGSCHGDRCRGGEGEGSHEEHCAHPPGPQRHHQRQDPRHPALHPLQERHQRGEPDQADPARPDPPGEALHDQERQQPGRQCGRGCK